MNNAFPTLILGAGPAAIQWLRISSRGRHAHRPVQSPQREGQRLKAHLAHTPSLHLEGVGKARQTQRDAQVAVTVIATICR